MDGQTVGVVLLVIALFAFGLFTRTRGKPERARLSRLAAAVVVAVLISVMVLAIIPFAVGFLYGPGD
jgi:hypothetical protein